MPQLHGYGVAFASLFVRHRNTMTGLHCRSADDLINRVAGVVIQKYFGFGTLGITADGQER
jgi:hypothetical protein